MGWSQAPGLSQGAHECLLYGSSGEGSEKARTMTPVLDPAARWSSEAVPEIGSDAAAAPQLIYSFASLRAWNDSGFIHLFSCSSEGPVSASYSGSKMSSPPRRNPRPPPAYSCAVNSGRDAVLKDSPHSRPANLLQFQNSHFSENPANSKFYTWYAKLVSYMNCNRRHHLP